ncbi:hypothetical protein IBE48_03790 [Francisella philomiragia]|uniref:Uncharacterized protein n=1 Tax=Francisella philomiragia TaxID=28110 RepID=A0AAW3DBR3_9GAMM|nr:hypothetical protein [Francisella philomiragia]KFJ42787.1 hypothetical protein DR78_1185 [Francisella philomiragia]MBK2254907.1 hypothetical protein [Francisella philomiragia]MBK2273220.1 hypothetical protein [Francisella philomiragia]MBK2277007.1 hypothetical protein [Francisella philomiragia]MBK2280981.1 hypothetical protein [Francisella philomiragia]
MTKKIKGSALLASLIFAFVILVVISALAYNYRMDSLSVSTILEQKQNIGVDEGYFGSIIGNLDTSQDKEETIDSYKFQTTIDSSSLKFLYEDSNAGLYESEPYLLSYKYTHRFFEGEINRYVREFIYNILPSSSVMTQYDRSVIPLNLPYVNAEAMSQAEYNYKIGSQNAVPVEGGYIGYLRKPVIDGYDGTGSESDYIVEQGNGNIKYILCHKPEDGGNRIVVSENSWDAHHDHGDYRGPCLDNGSRSFTINIYGNTLTMTFPDVLALSYYHFSIGWGLEGGQWTLYLAVYDLDRVYTSSATLNDIKNNPSTAEVSLSNWKEVSGLEEFDGGDIVNVTWYFDNVEDVPKLMILEKFLRSGSYDIDVYRTTYVSITKTYAATLTDRFVTGSTNFNDKEVFTLVPDSLFTLFGAVPLIFQGTNIIDFNYDAPYTLGDGVGSTKSVLTANVTNKPVIIKKNATQFYIFYYSGNTRYKYLYNYGVGAPSLVLPNNSFSGQTIQKIIAKYGALFIITNSNIYVENISNSALISRVAIYGANYQIARDSSGRIYAMPDGFTCTINGNCNTSSRVYLDSGCGAYSGGCDAMAELNNVSPYLNIVYKNFSY